MLLLWDKGHGSMTSLSPCPTILKRRIEARATIAPIFLKSNYKGDKVKKNILAFFNPIKV